VISSVLPASASAWFPVDVSMSGSTTATTPAVAINDAGYAVAAFSETTAGSALIIGRVHPPGGSWDLGATAPVTGGITGYACSPRVALDGAGNAMIVWAQWTGSGCTGLQTIMYSTRPAGAIGWSSPVALAAATDGDAGSTLSTATNAAGQTVVGWETRNGGDRTVFGAIGSPTGGFGAPVALSAGAAGDVMVSLTTGIGTGGAAAVQWVDQHGSDRNVQVAIRPAGAAFTANAPTDVTTYTSPDTATDDAVALDAAGDVLSAYTFSDATTTSPSLGSRFRPAGGAYQPPQLVGSPIAGHQVNPIVMGADGTGAVTAAWTETDTSTVGPPSSGRSAVRTPGTAGTWRLTSSYDAYADAPGDPQAELAVAESGATITAIDADVDTSDAIAFVTACQSPTGRCDLQPGLRSSVAIAPDGDAIHGFTGRVAGTVGVSVLDTQPPAVTNLNVPATAVAGQPVAMSATFADLWSPDALGLWYLGDTGTAVGSSITHTYAIPGTYTVTLTATDDSNVTPGTTRQIVVTAAPVTPASSLAKPRLRAAYVASRLIGTLSLNGRTAAPSTLSIAIRRVGAKQAASTVRLSVRKAGPWSKTIRLPTGLTPGSYRVSVSGTGVTGSSASFTLAAPASGIARSVYASAARHGRVATTLRRAHVVWAHFRFGTLPKKGRRITSQWIRSNGSKLAPVSRARAGLVEAQLRDPDGGRLPTGRWRCVLRVGGSIVATLGVRVT